MINVLSQKYFYNQIKGGQMRYKIYELCDLLKQLDNGEINKKEYDLLFNLRVKVDD